LHGHRLGFGMIEPGATKTRRLRLAVPADEPGPDVMLVLELAEGNDFAPPNVSRRITVVGPAAAPILAIRCALPGRGDRPSFNLGDIVSIQCVVDNTGASGAEVGLVTSIADAVVARSPAQPITTAGHATFELRVAIPRELTLDADVEIAVTAQDARSQRSARTSIVGTPRSPKVCAPGQLTRAQYQVKLRELRAAAAAGDLTQAQLDRYDAELVACLK
jgi:hypothetical protein